MKLNRTLFSVLLSLGTTLVLLMNSLLPTSALAQEVETYTVEFQQCSGTFFPETIVERTYVPQGLPCTVEFTQRVSESEFVWEMVSINVRVPSLSNFRFQISFGDGFFGNFGGGARADKIVLPDETWDLVGGGCSFLPYNYERGTETHNHSRIFINCDLEGQNSSGPWLELLHLE